jgi:hypothetical protein
MMISRSTVILIRHLFLVHVESPGGSPPATCIYPSDRSKKKVGLTHLPSHERVVRRALFSEAGIVGARVVDYVVPTARARVAREREEEVRR